MIVLKNVSIIGTGAYGTAIANVLADNDHSVTMYGIVEKEVNDINEFHINSTYFDQLPINSNIKACSDWSTALADAEVLILAVPTIAIKSVCKNINKYSKRKMLVINTAKGLDPTTCEVISKSLLEYLNDDVYYGIGAIYGPSIAIEVVKRDPTCIMAVSDNKEVADEIAKIFNNEYFITIANDDIVAAEYAAALKNSIAIALGMYSGLFNSDNAKASLITIGLNEIKTFALANNAKNVDSFTNFACLADLVLTASSYKSRNFQLGYEIAKQDDAKKVLETYKKTVEGVLTCKTVYNVMQNKNLKLPLFEALYEILYNFKKPSVWIQSVFSKYCLFWK